MDKMKQWVALTVLACLAIVAAGWFLAVSPKRSEAADLRTQAASQRSANAKLATELDVLKAQAKELPSEQAKLAAVAAKVPDNPALPSLIRNLLEAASGAGVELVSITPGDPVLPQPVVAQPQAAPANGQQAPAAPAAPGPAAPGPAGQLATIPLTVNVVGDYFEVQTFLAAAEELTRALRVDNLVLTPGLSPTAPTGASPEDGRSLTATVGGHVYMAVNRPAPVAATVPGGETAPAEVPAADAAAPTADSAE